MRFVPITIDFHIGEKQVMLPNPFNRLSPVNGKVFWKHGKQNAEQKNPGHYQKNFDHIKTKFLHKRVL